MELIQVKKTFVLQDTSVMGFLLCHTIFLFEYGGREGGGVLPHQRGTLSKNLIAKYLKEWALSIAMQLRKFHFLFLFLFSSQARKLLKYMDPVEKIFSNRVGVRLMTEKKPVQ